MYWANADEEAIQQMLAIEDGSPYDGYESAEGAGLPDGEGEIPETQVIPTHSDEEEEDVEDALPETPPASPTHVSAELEKSREDSHATASVLPKCGTHEPSQDSGATATVSPKHGTHEPSEDSDAAASVLPNRGTHVVAEPCDGASVVPACDLPFRGHPIRALLPLPGQWEELTPHPADPPAKTHAFDEAAASNKLTPEGRAKLLAHLASRKEKIRPCMITVTIVALKLYKLQARPVWDLQLFVLSWLAQANACHAYTCAASRASHARTTRAHISVDHMHGKFSETRMLHKPLSNDCHAV